MHSVHSFNTSVYSCCDNSGVSISSYISTTLSHIYLAFSISSLTLSISFKDVFISPLYKIALIQFNEYISIYKIEDGNIIAEPLEMIPINENEEVVMAEWCSGKYVEQWEKVFIDGEVILDNNY